MLKPESLIFRICNSIIQVNEQTQSKEWLQFVKISVKKVLEMIPNSHEKKHFEHMFKSFNIRICSTEHFELWSSVISSVGCSLFINTKESRVLLHFIYSELLKTILEIRNNHLDRNLEEISADKLKLSENEENILRYVAGYVPFSILKSIGQADFDDDIILLIHSWNIDQQGKDMGFLEYTKEWTNKIDRGGLFKVNDEFYIFIRRIENVARTILNRNLLVTYAGENLRTVLIEKFQKSKLINESWIQITRDIENSGSTEKLKKLIFNKWINIRANAFIKAWVDLVKYKYFENLNKKKDVTKTIDVKGQPALRKTLN